MNLTAAKAADRWLGAVLCRVIALWRTLREFVAPHEDLVQARTILLVKLWGLGNIVLLLPVVRLLRERHPDARLVFVSLARNRELLDACEDLDDRIYIRGDGAIALFVSLLAAVVRARRASPDVAVDFEQFARASVVLAAFAGAEQVIGLDTPDVVRTRLYHKHVRYDDTQHMSQTYLDLARAAGVDVALYTPGPPPIGDEARRAVDELLHAAAASGPLVVLHPGSGDNFQGRRWPEDSFAALADQLIADEGAFVVVTGSRGERDLTARVVASVARPERAIDAGGRLAVRELAALVERAAVVVANDTGPVHLGSAVGTPVLGLYGPNTPRLYGPLSADSHAFYRDLPCSPCLTNLNYKTSLCRMPVCVRGITVAEVAERARVILSRGASAVFAPSRQSRRETIEE